MTEAAQDYSGTVTVATAELNPYLMQVSLVVQDPAAQYMFYDPAVGSIPNTVIDLSQGTPLFFSVITDNNGDENIDVHTEMIIDGVMLVDTDCTNLAPHYECTGMAGIPTGTDLSPYLTVGAHIISWTVSARRSGTSDAFVEYYSGTTTYYCYTLGMDAIATTVSMTQNAVDKLWLVWNPETGFVPQGVVMEPDAPISFKFSASNPGDEPVRMYVGYYNAEIEANETGVLVDGIPLAMAIDYIDLDPGMDGVLETIAFTPIASFTVAFTILRDRLLL